jgi:glyoxylase-like metal-dependent hydrolase (beta-lactamase superfamily II)
MAASSFTFPTYPPLSTFPNPAPVQAAPPLHITIPAPAANINAFNGFFRPVKHQHAHTSSLDLIMAYPNSQDLLTSPMDPQTMPQPVIHAFPSRVTGTTTYIVVDPVTEEAAIINPILDLDPLTNAIKTSSADRLLKFVNDEGLTIKYILETTLHRDRISACRYVQLALKHIGDGVIPRVCIGENSFCTCGDEIEPSPPTPAPPQQQQHHHHQQHNRGLSSSNVIGSSIAAQPRSPPKSPDAFDQLFADNEPIRIGNMIATCTHLDDHDSGVVYSVAQHTFSSTVHSRSDDKDPSKTVINHPEPPPDKSNGNGPVSSRAKPTIDEVLGQAAEKMSLESGSNGTDDPSDASEKQAMEVKASPMLAFYAEQVNTRGGRIPRKINMPGGHARKMSGSPTSPQAAEGMVPQQEGGNVKGKEKETQQQQHQQEKMAADEALRRRRTSVSGLAQSVMPLRIPRKLGVIMC